MNIQEIRALSTSEIYEELDKTYRELMNLRFRDAANQLTDSNEPRKVQKDIARMKTVIRERELMEN